MKPSRKKFRGVAILTVMVSLALMMLVVTEMSTKELVRYKLAINERDAMQAEALAMGGANFALIILTVQEPLQKYLTAVAKMGIPLPAYTVWEIMPIDSDLLKGITDGSFLPEFDFSGKKKDDVIKNEVKEDAKDEKNQRAKKSILGKETPLFGPYEAPEGGYGGFRGKFSTQIEDEEKKISIRKWPKLDSFPKRKLVADQIFRILMKPEYAKLFDGSTGNEQISPSQIVARIYDYISEMDQSIDINAPKESFGRDGVGDKRSIYLTPGIKPKSAPMDSLAELRLIPGMNDGIYQVLSKILTIYGENDNINILSASDEVLASVFFMCTKNRETSAFMRPGFEEEFMTEWTRKKNEGLIEMSFEGIAKYLEEKGIEVDKEECSKLVGTESKTFTVKSTATVGNVTKTLLMRVRSAGGITTLYQFQFL